MLKRLTGILLAVLLCLSLCFPALAEGDDDVDATPGETTEVTADGDEYDYDVGVNEIDVWSLINAKQSSALSVYRYYQYIEALDELGVDIEKMGGDTITIQGEDCITVTPDGEEVGSGYEVVEDAMFDGGKADTTWKCLNCGHIHTGKNPPETCPVCSHPKGFFTIFNGN